MWQYAIKILVSATVLVAISEIAKRSSFFGALLASLPLTSLLAFIWLYIDTHDVQKVTTLSQDIFWLAIPSLVLFIVLPLLLKTGVNFWLSLFLSCVATVIAYLGTIKLLLISGINTGS